MKAKDKATGMEISVIPISSIPERFKYVETTHCWMEDELIVEDSEQKTDIHRFEEITTSMLETYKAKNADYGSSFSKGIDEYGYVSCLCRMSDKLNRLKTLMLGDGDAKVKEEKITDTLADLANYAILTLIEVEKRGKS